MHSQERLCYLTLSGTREGGRCIDQIQVFVQTLKTAAYTLLEAQGARVGFKKSSAAISSREGGLGLRIAAVTGKAGWRHARPRMWILPG